MRRPPTWMVARGEPAESDGDRKTFCPAPLASPAALPRPLLLGDSAASRSSRGRGTLVERLPDSSDCGPAGRGRARADFAHRSSRALHRVSPGSSSAPLWLSARRWGRICCRPSAGCLKLCPLHGSGLQVEPVERLSARSPVALGASGLAHCSVRVLRRTSEGSGLASLDAANLDRHRHAAPC